MKRDLLFCKISTVTKIDSQQYVSGAVCAFCGSHKLTEVIDFGEVAVAGAFLKKADIPNEKKYPLEVVFCTKCYVVQVKDHIDPEELFSQDYYFSSAIKTLQDHFSKYASEVSSRFLDDPKTAVVLEFGSNDGVLLRPLAKEGIGTVIGIEPAKNIVDSIDQDGFKVINDFFTVPVAESIVEEHGKVNLVMANNVYAHITDINGTTEAITTVLDDEGVFAFEVHYLGEIIDGLQYDFIYHEHIYYYSLIALENHFKRHNMVIFDLKPIPIHGGSVRYYAARADSQRAKNVSKAVTDLREKEMKHGYQNPGTYKKFADNINQRKKALMDLLDDLKANHKSVVGYGASGRANTIIQYCGIDSRHIQYMIDDAPAKEGMYTPGSHIEIKNSSVLAEDNPDYVLVFAWAFLSEIARRNQQYLDKGGAMIVPLPKVKTINSIKEIQ